jgi:hypothetical protein
VGCGVPYCSAPLFLSFCIIPEQNLAFRHQDVSGFLDYLILTYLKRKWGSEIYRNGDAKIQKIKSEPPSALAGSMSKCVDFIVPI